ncbi:hypothetical protein [Streptomyces sp. GD-15H]|uniref:hypothetical protein n=1 Tax=Streptomyces sp. GD-15H TaxID=3129112 RepID=UPI00387372E8
MAIRTRLKLLTAADERVLRRMGAHLGTPASGDLKTRRHDGLGHDAGAWAARRRELTPASSARWVGALTRATRDQWAPVRRCALARLQSLEAGVRTPVRRRTRSPGAARLLRAQGLLTDTAAGPGHRRDSRHRR